MPEPPEDDTSDDVSILLFTDDPRYKPPAKRVREKKAGWENPSLCDHKANLWVNRTVRTVECDKCGAFIDPIEALFLVGKFFDEIEWKYEANREFARKQRERLRREQDRRAARKGRAAPPA